jgi:lipoprotein Spr
MKKTVFAFAFFFAAFNTLARGTDPVEHVSREAVDREQQQLEWCFLYSNMFGFNISYISNPRLYKLAGEWLGTPYKYSGNTRSGIDCSGLVCELMRDGYEKKVSGSARDLFQMSKPLSRTDLREGDLVFFRIKKNKISHVGIFLGENKFVHASLKNGVIISDLNDPYYEKYFYKGGRLIQ